MTIRDYTAVLRTLDPAESLLTDLELFRSVLAGARVVGLGEGAHFVQEFTLARARLLRFLVEEGGFTTLAFELGETEAASLNPWLTGEGDEADLPRLAGSLTRGLFGELLSWLRRYNRGRSRPLRILGVDLPNTLTLRPDLHPVADYLREVDPEVIPLLDKTLGVSDEITGGSAAVSAPQWGALEPARQDALTTGLARLSLRLRALESMYLVRGDSRRYLAACRHLEAACHTDLMLRAMNGLFTGQDLPGETSIRDHFMARTVLGHLASTDPQARVVVIAHNNHVQKTPLYFGGKFTAFPMGHYLSRDLGLGYRAVALTHTGSTVPEMIFPAAGSPVGFTIDDIELAEPVPRSIERAVLDAGFGGKITLTDLRAAQPAEIAATALTSIRTQSANLEIDLRQAFDAVLTGPAATRDDTIPF